MRNIELSALHEDFIEDISKEWMLITAGTINQFNTMTASWGGLGFLWGKPVAFIFVRPERYTHEFLEKEETFTLSFLGQEHKHIYNICGNQSGRNINKVEETGLIPIQISNHSITFEQARLTLDCRKLYKTEFLENNFIDKSLLPKWYGKKQGNLHTMYIAEIVQTIIND